MAKLIGFTGSAGSGKSTASKALTSIGWVNVKMAGPLKDMLRAIGFTEDHIEGDLKEVPSNMLSGKTPRYAMQTLGTEWGRDIIGPEFWINIAKRRIEDQLSKGNSVVVDDVRFQNEADMIRSLGGSIVGIKGRGGINGSHVSEIGILSDFNIMNDGSIERFTNDIRYILHGSEE